MEPKMTYLSILVHKFENITFEISILEFTEMQKIVQNKKKVEFGTKMPYLGILGYCIVIFEISNL